MKNLFRSTVLWTFGGTIYFLVEVAWKLMHGNPNSISWTMLVLAAIICIPLDQINEHLSWDTPLWIQAIICGIGITLVEFIAGAFLNILLGMGVWDYSSMPFNIRGQICLPFTVLWCFVSLIGIVIFDWLRYFLYGEERPRYKMR